MTVPKKRKPTNSKLNAQFERESVLESKRFVPEKIVSGGQTGVDRAGLDVAIALNLAHGGWCPSGRLSEDGTIPSRYEMSEMETNDYPSRTKQNVIDSDATLILYEGRLSSGTMLTWRTCQKLSKECKLVRLDRDPSSEVIRWLQQTQPLVLNIAGPRETSREGIYDRAMEFLLEVFA